MTDGVFAALASSELPPERRATGLALVGTCNDVGRLVSSIVFGWLWSRGAPERAAQLFIPMLGLALVLSVVVTWRVLRDNR
jgi:MFS family permease